MGDLLDGVRLLLVEDDDDFRLLLETFLAGEGAIVYAAPHAAAALDGLEHFRPSILSLDLALPDIDGASLLAQLRHRPGAGRTPALLLTGQPRTDALALAHRVGFDAFLAKPVDLETIATTVAWLATGPREPRALQAVSPEREVGSRPIVLGAVRSVRRSSSVTELEPVPSRADPRREPDER